MSYSFSANFFMAKMNDDLNSNQGQNTFTSSNIECEKLRLSDSISEYDR